MSDFRINRQTAREIQIRRIRKKHGLTYRQADLLAGWCFGEVAS